LVLQLHSCINILVSNSSWNWGTVRKIYLRVPGARIVNIINFIISMLVLFSHTKCFFIQYINNIFGKLIHLIFLILENFRYLQILFLNIGLLTYPFRSFINAHFASGLQIFEYKITVHLSSEREHNMSKHVQVN
jgi:hypothetical protein